MSARTFHHVAQSRAVKGGHVVELDLAFNADQVETIEISSEKLALLSNAIQNAAAVAERMRRALPGETVSTEVPYFATDVRTGSSVDNRYVLFRFPTTIGTPMNIAMTPEIARHAIERLTTELDNLGRQPPLVRS
jgi:hypothetical protein